MNENLKQSAPLMELRGITKRFPGVTALSDVSLSIHTGEVLALVGENGAGKSTLIKVMTGFHQMDEGEILIDGTAVTFTHPNQAIDAGIACIYQELSIVPDIDVAKNLFLGNWPKKGVFLDNRTMYRKAKEILSRIHLDVDPHVKASNLSIAQQQMLEIGRALTRDARIIIMDEPTAAITDREVELLFGHIRRLKEKGVAIIYISHRMAEIFSICDRVSVYRDGQYIGTGTTTELDEGQLIKMMVGREITDVYPKLEADIGEVVFEAKNIVRADNKVKGVSLSVRRGEILGIGGLVGAGRSELVEGIFGMHALSQGEIFVHGKRVKISSPEDIIKQGVALITEDRKVTGLNLSGTVNDNIAMVAIKKLLTHGLYNKGKARRASEEYIEKLNIKTPSADQIVGNLSGGNQQKIVIAKWLLNDPDIIILDEPTRGIDVGAKRDIYLLLGNLVRQGKAVIMISSEIPELMGICDRIMVMCEGNYSGEVSREEFSQERIMTLASAIKV